MNTLEKPLSFSSSHRLAGQVALVTGGSRGIGAAIVKELASQGAAVAFTYSKSASQADALAAEVNESGGQALAIQTDVSVPAQAAALVESTIARFGKLDILVNNAGVAEFGAVDSIDLDHIRRQFSVNVEGPILVTSSAVKHMKAGGRIINISSVVAIRGFDQGSVYSATKGALDAFTRSAAVELGPRGITVNAIQPGPVATDMFTSTGLDSYQEYMVAQTPMGRIGAPNDISGAVSLLAGPESGWITGQTITASGGFRV